MTRTRRERHRRKWRRGVKGVRCVVRVVVLTEAWAGQYNMVLLLIVIP